MRSRAGDLLRWFAYTYTYNLRFRRCVLPGRSIAGGHRNCRGRRTFAHRCVFFSMSPPRVCPTLRDLLFVWHVPFSNFVYWLILHTLQAKRKDTVTSSKSSTDQCRLVGLQIQPAAGDGIVGGNRKRQLCSDSGDCCGGDIVSKLNS